MSKRKSPRGGRPLVESLEPRLLLAADWTFLVYMAADNNLEAVGIADVNEMEQVGSTAQVNIVVQLDRTPLGPADDPPGLPPGFHYYDDSNGDWSDTRRGLIQQDANTSVISSTLTSIGEVDMSDPESLREFITWGVTNYPADHYALVIWDHGGGIDGVEWDWTTGMNKYMTVAGVGQALSQAGVHFGVIAFDACLMGMIEVAHELADRGDVMVASEEVIPWDGFPYDTIVGDLVANPQWTASQLAESMVTRYGEYHDPSDYSTLSAVDLGAVPALSGALDNLADAFLTQDADWDVAVEARWQAARFPNHYWYWYLNHYPQPVFADLGGALDYIATNATNASIQSAAAGAVSAYNTAVLSNYSEASLGGTGLSVFYPGSGQRVPLDYTSDNYSFAGDTSWGQFLERLVPESKWTVLVYMDGDNNVEDFAIADLNEMEWVGSTDEVNIVVQLDRSPWYDYTNGDWSDTRRGLVQADADTQIIHSYLTSVGEVNTGDPTALSQFIQWGVANYPAERYALILWDHGAGIDEGFLVDETDGDDLTVGELGGALSLSGAHFDLVVFNACLMGMIEVAHEIADYANVMVASEELMWATGPPYDEVLGDLVSNPYWSGRGLAQDMVTRYEELYSPTDATTLSAVDLTKIPALSAAVDHLADTFLTERADMDVALGVIPDVPWFPYYDPLFGAPWLNVEAYFSDLGGVLEYFAANATNANIQAAAADAKGVYDSAILSNYSDYLDPPQFATGLSIFYPWTSDLLLEWRPLFGSADAYSGGNFAFAAETSWPEFLATILADQPEITVLDTDGVTDIPDGQAAPISFGSVPGASPYVTQEFTIRNDGTADLNLSGLTVPDGFIAEPFPLTALPPGWEMPLRVTLVTDVQGSYAGDVVITSDDFDEAVFNFAIAGDVVPSGEVTVLYFASPLVDGTSLVVFEAVGQGEPTVQRLFTIRNEGPGSLHIGATSATEGFIVSPSGSDVLGVGATTSFTVRMDSSVMGVHAGTVSIINSDSDETPFDFSVSGIVIGPDLEVAGVNYLPGAYASGADGIALSTLLTNAGFIPLPVHQPVEIEARLSQDTTWGNGDDIIVYQGSHHLPNLGTGANSRTYRQVLATSFGQGPPGDYYLAVRVNPEDDIDEMDLGNNTWWSPEADIELYDGSHYTRLVSGSKVTFWDNAGRKIRASFSGPGYADLLTTNALTYQRMAGDLVRIVVGQTTTKSKLTLKVTGGATEVSGILVINDIGSLIAGGVNILGDVLIGGTAGKIVLGDIADAHSLLIGAPGAANGKAAVDITLGRVAELNIFSGTPVSSLSVQEWLDLDATPDIVQTPWIGKLASAGDFMAGLLLDGTGAPNGTLGTTRIRGDLREAIWTIVGSMGKFTVDGTVADSTIRTTAGMGKIAVGAADGADFLAGVADAVSRHADLAGDFANPAALIEGFSVKGLKNGAAARYFQDSNLSAAAMGAVDLLNAEFDNGGTKFGLYALSAGTGKEIKSVKYSDTVTRAKWKFPWDPAEAPDTLDFEIRVI